MKTTRNWFHTLGIALLGAGLAGSDLDLNRQTGLDESQHSGWSAQTLVHHLLAPSIDACLCVEAAPADAKSELINKAKELVQNGGTKERPQMPLEKPKPVRLTFQPMPLPHRNETPETL